ncbi:flagellar basal-body MS-ring/collar protein FliF [Aliagarivorans marinus]|uniref:flagellar basal-body MS-ring/collar protein FliF n=1 Tax=Aliagarivorans marinus TaxID=561965 RepID=UPI000401FF37|nr:flagellar basal-body MS-ring/collar protein FliF [Aliagarivorans marinus]
MSQEQALLEGDNESTELAATEQQSSTLSFLGNTDMLRQVIIILALAVCLAMAVFLLMWAKEPEMRPLGSMTTDELVQTLDFLDQSKIPYTVEGSTVLVNAEQYQDIRLRLRRAGLSETTPAGEEILLNDMGFGVSQRLEGERLKLSRERQLASAIEQMRSVSKARVLLAIPKQNVFARREQQPSATVIVNLRNASGLKQEEIDSIVDMVASAVHNLVPSRVTVTDQNGRLLNSGSQDPLSSRTRREFEMERQREEEYRDKIDAILAPVVGLGNYTAEVDVTLDFTAVEQTQKRFNPDLPAVRSEYTVEDNNVGPGPIGIPGALTNQPPLPADIPEQVNADGTTSMQSGSSHRESTRNYELDTTISHTRQQVGAVQRISVSVALDYIDGPVGEGGEANRIPRTAEQLTTIRRLLQGGVGFNLARGDTLEVVTVPFSRPEALTDIDVPVWEQAWFWRAMRIVGSVLVLIVLIVAVVRPMLKRMIDSEEQDDVGETDLDAALAAYDGDEDVDLITMSDGEMDFGIREGQLKLPDLHKDEDMLKAVRALVANEPDLAAMVIKDWVINDGK